MLQGGQVQLKCQAILEDFFYKSSELVVHRCQIYSECNYYQTEQGGKYKTTTKTNTRQRQRQIQDNDKDKYKTMTKTNTIQRQRQIHRCAKYIPSAIITKLSREGYGRGVGEQDEGKILGLFDDDSFRWPLIILTHHHHRITCPPGHEK